MGKEYMVDVTHIGPFYFDPNYVIPLNIVAKDTNEYFVETILVHDFSDYNRWLVKWASTEASNETWETYETLKALCFITTRLLFPQRHRLVFQLPSMLWKASGVFTLPVPPNVPTDVTTITTPTISRKRGRPKIHKM